MKRHKTSEHVIIILSLVLVLFLLSLGFLAKQLPVSSDLPVVSVAAIA